MCTRSPPAGMLRASRCAWRRSTRRCSGSITARVLGEYLPQASKTRDTCNADAALGSLLYIRRGRFRIRGEKGAFLWFMLSHVTLRVRRRQLQNDPKPLGPLNNFDYRHEKSPFSDASHKTTWYVFVFVVPTPVQHCPKTAHGH